MPSKVSDEKYRTRVRVLRKLENHGRRRKEHMNREARLQREQDKLIREARACIPPISQQEIARLTLVSQPTVSRLIKEQNTND